MIRKKTIRNGTAAVELAVCLPFLLVLITGVWEVGRMVQAEQIIAQGAREGARELAAGQVTAATVKDYVVNYCVINGLTGVDSSMVTLTNITNASRNDPMTCNQLDQWRVTVQVPYSVVKYSTLAQITPTTILVASADWYSMKDLALSINATIPTN